jgi:hypothetical protein
VFAKEKDGYDVNPPLLAGRILIKTAAKNARYTKPIEATKMPERKNLSGNKSIPTGSHLLA